MLTLWLVCVVFERGVGDVAEELQPSVAELSGTMEVGSWHGGTSAKLRELHF
jgi:hypothetical protein